MAHNPFSILLVEDDEAARGILASVLAMKFPRITFHVADNGKSGLECFQKHFPAIVITDVNMPVMDGIRMARGIKNMDEGVKLIVLTAFDDKAILETTAVAGIGIDHYILKPVDYAKLFTAIEQSMAGVESRDRTRQGNDDEAA